MENCIFCKIDRGEIPAEKIYEDDKVFVVKDIAPHAPVHLLIVPHEHTPTLLDLEDYGIVAHVFKVASELAKRFEIAEQGFIIRPNVNEWGGQRVFHIHFHLLGGRKFD